MTKDLIFETQSDAETVLVDLKKRLEKYGVVSLVDFYDIAGMTLSDYSDYNYGWSNLEKAYVSEEPYGYLVNLPAMVDIRGI